MRRDVQEIFRSTPHGKQVMMFSATLSKEIRPVCKKFMQDVNISVSILLLVLLLVILLSYISIPELNHKLQKNAFNYNNNSRKKRYINMKQFIKILKQRNKKKKNTLK